MVQPERMNVMGVCNNCTAAVRSHQGDDARCPDALPRQPEHERVELLTRHRHLRPWIRVGAAARTARCRCRRARGFSCDWHVGWRTGRHGAVVRHRRSSPRASAASVTAPMSIGSVASHTASTRINAATRAATLRTTMPIPPAIEPPRWHCLASVRRGCAERHLGLRLHIERNEVGHRQSRNVVRLRLRRLAIIGTPPVHHVRASGCTA